MNTLRVQIDSPDYKKTLTFDDPKENLGLSDVRTAFATLLDNGWLIDQNGNDYSSVSSASYVVTTPIT